MKDRRFSSRYEVNLFVTLLYGDDAAHGLIINMNRDGACIYFKERGFHLHEGDKLTLSFCDRFDYLSQLEKNYEVICNSDVIWVKNVGDMIQAGISINDRDFQQYYDDYDATVYISNSKNVMRG